MPARLAAVKSWNWPAGIDWASAVEGESKDSERDRVAADARGAVKKKSRRD
jgi:hypothetical protein